MQFPSPILQFSLRIAAASLLVLGLRFTSGGPVHAKPDPQRQGAELFGTSGCTHCHGTAGAGTERGPSLKDVRKHLSQQQISRQIKDGGQAMPAFGSVLSDSQIEDLVLFLHAPSGLIVPTPGASGP